MFNSILNLGSSVSAICYMPKLLEIARHIDTHGLGDMYYFIVDRYVKSQEQNMISLATMNTSDILNDTEWNDTLQKHMPFGDFEMKISMYNVISENEQAKVVMKLTELFVVNEGKNAKVNLFDFLMEKLGEDNAVKIFLGNSLYERCEGFLHLGKITNTRLHDGNFYKYYANITYPFVKAIVTFAYPKSVTNVVQKGIEVSPLKDEIEKFVDEYMQFSKTHLNVECDAITCL